MKIFSHLRRFALRGALNLGGLIVCILAWVAQGALILKETYFWVGLDFICFIC